MTAREVAHRGAEDLATLAPDPVDVILSRVPCTVLPHERQRRTSTRPGVLTPSGRSRTLA
jgi:phosphatidylethanolamine/phosphatidyl-N-methylethanolamine N-methyltransferase